MPNHPTHPHRRHSRLTEVKWFIATLSVAGTLSFWILFARQWVLQTAANAVPMDTPEAQQQDNTLVLDLPPMPTLIPTPTDLPAVASSQMVVDPLPSVKASAPQTTGKILLGGSAPSQNNNNRQGQKNTSTRTRSSQ
jgi:hypothetical protein